MLISNLRLFASLLISIICACNSSSSTVSVKDFSSDSNIRIGILVGLSNQPEDVQALKRTILQLATADANAKLRAKGDTRSIELVVEDTTNSSFTARQKAESLAEQGIGFIAGLETSAEAIAVKAFLELQGMIGISTSATAPILGEEDTIYTLAPNDEHQAKVFIDVFKEANKTTIFNLLREDIYGTELLRELSERAEDTLGENSFEAVSYDVEQIDFRPPVNQLETLVESNNEVQTDPTTGALLFTSFSEVIPLIEEIKKPQNTALRALDWYGTDSMLALSTFLSSSAASEAFTHHLKAVGLVVNPTYTANFSALAKRIIDANSTAKPLDLNSANLYDAISLIADTVLAIKSNDIHEVMQTLERVSQTYIGARGKIDFDRYGGQELWAYGLHELKKNADGMFYWELIKVFEGKGITNDSL